MPTADIFIGDDMPCGSLRGLKSRTSLPESVVILPYSIPGVSNGLCPDGDALISIGCAMPCGILPNPKSPIDPDADS